MTYPPAVRPMSGPRAHAVQLYGHDDDALVAGLARYVRDGLVQGDATLVISTTAHWGAVLHQLRREGVGLAGPVREGTLVFLDADAVLARLVSEDPLSWESFQGIVGAEIRRLRARSELRGLRVFGEVVGLLWLQGRCATALHLEELWNRLAETDPFQLHCAYPIEVLGEESERAHIGPVLQLHSHLMLGGMLGGTDSPAAGRSAVDEVDRPGTAPAARVVDRTWYCSTRPG